MGLRELLIEVLESMPPYDLGYRSGLEATADALLSSGLVEQIKAEGWSEGYKAGRFDGVDLAIGDGPSRQSNPYAEFDRFMSGYIRKPSREDVYRTLREVGLGLGMTEGMRHQVLNDGTDAILAFLERTDR